MSVNGWRYYNHAAIPSIPPHDKPDISVIEDGSIWKMEESPLLARWSTRFDCGYETNWWYVIKDTPFDICALKSKRRYVINKGKKCFDVCKIDAKEYKEALYAITIEAYKSYPKKYRPNVKHDDFISSIGNGNKDIIYGAFYRETKKLCGYALLKDEGSYMDLSVVKTIPEYERFQINAAIVCKILEDYQDFLSGGYICDGSRNISHETSYQDYLEKYFGFRKAYCELHIVYNPKVKWLINLVYPFRKILFKIDKIRIVHQVNSILKMEELVRG